MTTARQFCFDAIMESGALGVGQSPLAEDITDAYNRLKRMVAQWQKSRWLVPSLQVLSFLADGSKSYSVGIGGKINIKRPGDIKGGYVVQLNTGSNPVSLQLSKIFSYEDYIRIAVKDLHSLPTRFFYDAQNPLANIYPYPIPDSQYQLNFLIQNLIGFGDTVSLGAIKTGGTLYTDGIYQTVALIGGSGVGAIADITITGGVVVLVGLSAGGDGYKIGDILSVTAASVGGTGSGFTWIVNDVTSNVDTELVMPEEYEEAIMYNLAIRVCSMYQVEPLGTTMALAKAARNTLRKNNTQVPTLTMPNIPGVKTGRSFNIFNADGY